MAGIRFGVVVFPGSNCDHDAYDILKRVMRQEARFLWHKDSSLGDVDVVILPGGFSYGDYLRCGAIARFSPIIEHTRSNEMFSSWPLWALMAGVNNGSGNRSLSRNPGGKRRPQIVPCSLYSFQPEPAR